MADEAQEARRGGGLGFIPWLLGFLISTFSIATLVYQGIVTEDPSAPIQALLTAYHDGIGIVFDPVERVLAPALHWLAGLVGWEVELHPHWRDVFLLSMIIFLAHVRVFGGARDVRRAAIYFAFGLLGSLAGALIAGSATLGGGQSSEAIILWVPFGAVFTAFSWAGAAEELSRSLRLVFAALARGLGFAATSAVLATRTSLPYYDALSAIGVVSPGLLLLGVVVIFVALSSLVLGAGVALFERGTGAPPLARVWRKEQVRTGLVMLGGFVGAALLFAADAALKVAP